MSPLAHTPIIPLPDQAGNLKLVDSNDLQALLRVYQQCEDFLSLAPHGGASEMTVLQDLAYARQMRGRFYGVYLPTDELVGVLEVIPADPQMDPRRAFIALLMIAEAHRNRGLGSRVVQAVEAWVQQDPHTEVIDAGVQTENPCGVRFWQHCGFAVVSTPQLQPDQTITVVMRKKLGSAGTGPLGSGLTKLPYATLCFPVRGQPVRSVLMGYKKSGFGQGKFTGFGGKIEAGESPLEAALRELHEESGLTGKPEAMQPAGRLTFLFPHRPEWSQRVYVFLLNEWRGQPGESPEMRPDWFKLSEIPYERMWDDGRYWLPPILAGKAIEAIFIFGPDNQQVVWSEIAPD